MLPYENDHSRLLNRFAHDADALAEKAAAWSDHLAQAKVEAASATDAFLSDFSPGHARELADANAKVAAHSQVASTIENSGGPSEARARALKRTEVFNTFAKGFAERIVALQKLAPVALKRLGERRAALTETGIHSALIEIDPRVLALRNAGQAITDALAVATFGAKYAHKRGGDEEPRTFDQLLADLTAPLPQIPTA